MTALMGLVGVVFVCSAQLFSDRNQAIASAPIASTTTSAIAIAVQRKTRLSSFAMLVLQTWMSGNSDAFIRNRLFFRGQVADATLPVELSRPQRRAKERSST